MSPTPPTAADAPLLDAAPPSHDAAGVGAPADRSTELARAARAARAERALLAATGALGAGWALAAGAGGPSCAWARAPEVVARTLRERRVPAPLAVASCCVLLACGCALLALVGLAAARAEARRRRGASELERATWLSTVTFWWATPTLRRAARHGRLALADLPELASTDEPTVLFRRFAAGWAAAGRCEAARPAAGEADASAAADALLPRAPTASAARPAAGARAAPRGVGGALALLRLVLWRCQRRVFARAFVCGWGFLASMLLDPPLMQRLLDAAQAREAAQRGGGASGGDGGAAARGVGVELTCVALLSANMLLRVSLMELCYFTSVRVAANARAALVVGVFRTALLADSARGGGAQGGLTNLMATDADKVGKAEGIVWFAASWSWALLSLPVVLWQLWLLLGPAAALSVCTLLASNQLAWSIAQLQIPRVRRLQEARDARAAVLGEVVRCARLIKLSRCEAACAARLERARARELRELRELRYLAAASNLASSLLQLAVPAATFGWYTLVQGRLLTPAVAFTSLAWIGQMRWSISVLPAIFGLVSTLLPSAQRLAAALEPLRAQPPPDGDSASGAAALDGVFDEAAPPPPAGYALVATGATVLHGGGAAGPDAADEAAPGGAAAVDARAGAVFASLDLSVRSNELLLVVGAVGSGKSSLLDALSRARPLGGGELRVCRRRALVSQRPFLLNGSVHDNVLFGLDLQPARYEDALERAALRADLRALHAADSTLVGEAGVQLSGGQRARLALARALYSDADAFFFDDVLGAVDAHTGRELWERAITHLVVQRGKAVVLATHQLQWLPRREVARVALASGGRIAACAPYEQLQRLVAHGGAERGAVGEGGGGGGGGGDDDVDGGGAAARLATEAAPAIASELRALLAFAAEGAAAAAEDARLAADGARAAATSARAGDDAGDGNEGEHGRAAESDGEGDSAPSLSLGACERLLASALRHAEGRVVDAPLAASIVARLRPHAAHGNAAAISGGGGGGGGVQGDDHGGCSADERVRTGLIAWVDFRAYLRHFGSAAAVCALLGCALGGAALSVGANAFLATWTDANTSCALARRAGRPDDPSCAPALQRAALGRYLALGVGGQLCVCAQAVLLTLCALRASTRLHAQVAARLVRAPLAFFERTASGAVLNRLLADVQSVDTYVPNCLSDLLDKALQLGTQLALVLALAPWAALALPLVLPAYAAIFARVRPASRDSRRLEAAAHSPVYSHFADALSGTHTIAAYGAQHRFCAANARLVANMSRAKVGNEAVNKWAQALTTQTGCVLYAVCAVSCVLLLAAGRLSSSQLGLVLVYAASLQRAAMDGMMQLTALETQFVAVERLAEYTRLDDDDDELRARGAPPRADSAESPLAASPLATPAPPGAARGCELDVRRVWLRYAPDRPPVLRGISLRLAPGCKVALCGRTGCGKSSLFGAIARLYALDAGDVRIDGRSAVHAMRLVEARAAVRVVSQDALLLDGSLRANLLADFAQLAHPVGGGHGGDDDGGGAPLEAGARDAELWRALEQAGVGARVRALPGGLGARVGSSTFSEGERQLLSLARGLVGSPRLLLADEPTACVDLHADERVHNVLLGLDATVLMICHRLQHVCRFDEVLLMHAGEIVERGTPEQLLRAPASRLGALCARAGLDADALLLAAARRD